MPTKGLVIGMSCNDKMKCEVGSYDPFAELHEWDRFCMG